MYAKYTYVAGSTTANILADVVKLLTGTTDKALLSANCDQANTEILTTYNAAGWTLHDAAAAAGKQVITSPQADVGEKFVTVDVSEAGALKLGMAEAWNATSHVGTNYWTAASSLQQRINISAGGSLYISASVRRIATFSYQSGAVGNANSNTWSFTAERQRGIMWWDTLAAAYPLSFYVTGLNGLAAGSTSGSGSIRIRNAAALTDLFNFNAGMLLDTPGKGSSAGLSVMPIVKPYGVTGEPVCLVMPIYVQGTAPFFMGGNLSTGTDFWLLQAGVGSNFDELTHAGKNRVLWMNSNTNGSGSLLVPKG